MKFKKATLPNGLRIITVPTPGNRAATVMVLAEVGSNYESKDQNGLSHFIEHMCFKGTPSRPSSIQINKELDSLGSRSNAMTSEEYTGYYAKAEKKHWKKILDILSDIYLHPIFPKEELEKERGVITQEISMYEDQPQYKASILFPKLLYGDVPAGRWTAGTKESVSKFKQKDFVNYKNTHYIASKTIVVVAGDVAEKEIHREVERLFQNISVGKKASQNKVVEKQTKPALLVEKRKTDQTHLVLGVRSFGAKDRRIPAISVLSGVLGGGMSSRLWHRLREEMGVSYYVYSSVEEFTDHGFFSISAGVDKKRVDEVVKALLFECKRLCAEPIDKAELDKTKDYLVGNLYLGLETTSALANFYSFQEVIKGNPETPQDIEKEIRKVTAEDIQRVAKEIFQTKNLNLAIVGDIKNPAGLRKILKF